MPRGVYPRQKKNGRSKTKEITKQAASKTKGVKPTKVLKAGDTFGPVSSFPLILIEGFRVLNENLSVLASVRNQLEDPYGGKGDLLRRKIDEEILSTLDALRELRLNVFPPESSNTSENEEKSNIPYDSETDPTRLRTAPPADA